MAIYRLNYESKLDITPEEGWAWITSVEGIQKEMAPFIRMTSPEGVMTLQDAGFTLGQPMFLSWLKLFGIIPIDYSRLTLIEFQEGVGLVERSPMGSMKLWQHRREVIPTGKGCNIKDALEFEPRFIGKVTCWCINRFFKHRHRQLRRYLKHNESYT